MGRVFRTVVVATVMVAAGAVSAMAAEYQCQRGDAAIRLATEVEKAGRTLPCEVVVEDRRGQRVVLWRAEYDRQFCPSRLKAKIAALEEDGWACRRTSDQNVVRGTGKVEPQSDLAAATPATRQDATTGGGAAPTDGAAVVENRQCRRGGDIRRIQVKVENPKRGTPCELIYWAEDDKSPDGALLWRAENDPTFCPTRLDFIIRKWSAEGWQCTAGDVETAALSTDQPAVAGPPLARPAWNTGGPKDLAGPVGGEIDPALQAVVEKDARRIGEWMEVQPSIEIAAHGDLNADGTDDAVVFLAYQSDQAVYRQYLMSYLVTGETYRLASVKLLTGVSPPPANAKVQRIDKGVIWLSMPGEQGAETTAKGFVLRDQQLLEVGDDDPPPVD